jgi:hypothetical protein
MAHDIRARDTRDDGDAPGRRGIPTPVAVAGGIALAVLLGLALFMVMRATPGAALTRAVDSTLAQGSAATTITGMIRDVPLVGDVTLSVAEGELDMDGEAARLRRDLPVVSGRDLPLVGEIGDVELLYADGGAWIRGPLDVERAWIRVSDPQDDAVASAPGLGNPLALLALVRAIEGTPEELEQETLAGMETTRYRVIVDLDALDGEIGSGSRQLLDRLRTLHEDGRLPVDVWVDGDDLIRRIRYDVDVDLPALPSLRVATEVDLDRHGLPVSIEAPSEDEVVEVSRERIRDLGFFTLLRDWIGRLPFVGD